jgi:Reverse transcriptase (RNA-dependent DNA polymerase)
LIGKYYNQIYDIDYQETFALVAKVSIVRILLSITVNQNWILQKMGVKKYISSRTLEEEAYITISPDHREENIIILCTD